MTNKAGRPGKNQRTCNACRKPCLPKNGDWFTIDKEKNTQIFICKDCERTRVAKVERAIPLR